MYSPVTTGKKAAVTATTVSVSSVLAIIIAAKLQPVLLTNGVDIDQTLLIVGVTTFLQSCYTAVTNWFKNRRKK